MFTWGQRWLEPVDYGTCLTHEPCGNELRLVLTCGACGETISRHDVTLTDHGTLLW